MFTKSNFLKMVSLLSLLVSLSANICSANEPDQPAAKPSLKNQNQTMAADALGVILEQATATQRLLRQVSAVFRVTHEVDVNQLPEVFKHTKPNLTYNNGRVTGTLRWLRNGVNRRLERRFDIPEKYMMHEYENFIFVDDGEKQVHAVLRTNQIAIVSSGEISSMVPTDWLQPGFRQDFGELRNDQDIVFEGFTTQDDRVLIRINKPMGPDQTVTVDAWLSPELDYAVVEWRCNLKGSVATINYERDEDNHVIPVKAVMTIHHSGQTRDARRMTLETESITLGPPDPDELAFQLQPGMVFADNRYAIGGSHAKVFRVGPDGAFEEIGIVAPSANPPSKARTIGLGVTGVLGVVFALALRELRARKRRITSS